MAKSILVMEDGGHGLGELTDALERNGYAVRVVGIADDPSAIFAEQQPELLFLSLLEPKAVNVCESIRDNPDGAIVPIIFVGTGKEAVKSPSDALTQGGDYYFELPLDESKVLAKVQTYIGLGEKPAAAPAPPPPSAAPVPAPGVVTVPASIPPPPAAPSPTAPPPPAPLPPAPPMDADASPVVPGAGDLATGAAAGPQWTADDTDPGLAAEAKGRAEDLIADFPTLPDFGLGESTSRRDTDPGLTAASDSLLDEIRAAEADGAAAATQIPAADAGVAPAAEPSGDVGGALPGPAGQLDAAGNLAGRLEPQELETGKTPLAHKGEAIVPGGAAKMEAQQAEEEETLLRAEEEVEAQLQVEAEARRKAEREEAELKAEQELRQRAEEEARRKAEEEIRLRAEAEARRKAEEEARKKAEDEARRKAEEEARKKAEDEARRKAEEEARKRAEQEARRKAEEEARKRAEEEARQKAEEEARRKAEQEARRRAEEEARQKAQEEARRKAEEEVHRRAEEEARRKAEEEARRAAEEEARRRAEEKARREAEQEARHETEEARLEAEEEARRKAEEQAKLSAEAEAKEREEKIRREVEAEVRQKMGLPAEPVAPEPAAPRPVAGTPADPQAWDRPTVRAPRRPVAPAPLAPMSTAEGEFGGNQDIAVLLCTICEQQVTGRVDFTSEDRKKSVFFEHGSAVNGASSQVFDRMEEYLYREGKITRAQYQDIRVKQLRSPRRIGAYLVTEGYLKPEELFEAVRGHLESIVFGLFEWESGSYVFLPEHVEEDDRVILDVDARAVIVEGIRRKYLMQRLMARLGAPSTLLAPAEGRAPDLDELGLTPEEKQLVRLVDGTRSIEDLVFSTGLVAQRVYQTLYAMVALGIAEVRVRGIEGLEEDGTSASDAIDRDRIREKLEQVRKLDYFQILGMPHAATAYEIDLAYERIHKEFTANRFSEAVRREMAEELAEIERVIEDARQVLRDEALRDAYARHIG